MTRDFLTAWLGEDAQACALVDLGVRSPALRSEAVRRAASRRIAPGVAAALLEEPEHLAPSAARRANVEALIRGNAAAIVTGQQVGLFLGPLFTLYKAASAIALARTLEAEASVRCVPVFWLQTEDHDFAEINHCHIPGHGKVALADDERRISVGHRVLGGEIDDVVATLGSALEGLPHACEVLAWVREAYRPGRPLAGAFAALLSRIFAEEGLVFVDPRHPKIAAEAAPILGRSIREHARIDEILTARRTLLEAAGFAEQVPQRTGSPLAFFHVGSPEGPRHRLSAQPGAFSLIGADGKVAMDELGALDPLRLSSSALLRPIVQDTLLPTAAYVGGPGELSYFAQLAPLYRHFGIEQPLFALRARLRWIEPTIASLLGRAGLSAADLEQPRDVVLGRAVRSDLTPPAVVSERLLGALRAELDALDTVAATLDPNLEGPIARTRETVERAVGRLVERYARARAEKDHVAMDRVDRLQAALFPGGEPQERVFGFASFAAKIGLADWKARVLAAIRPFEPAIVDVRT